MGQTIEEPRTITFHGDDMVTYDDNLFRLPSDHSPYTALLNPGSSTSDYNNSATLGMNGVGSFDRQMIRLQIDVADNNYLHNTALDNVSGLGKLVLDWQLGNQLSGKLGADYSRSLADFANTLFFSKDLISTTDYYGKAIWELGPHWSLSGLVSRGMTTHSNAVRDGDDYEARSGELGIQYAMSSVDSLALNYEFTYANFRDGITFDDLPFNRNYEDNKTSVYLKYSLGAVTWLEASAGYLDRRYPDVTAGIQPIGNFSGDVWSGSLRWQPSLQSGIKVSGWRDLRANLDAESNYYVSRGGTIAPVWSPVEQVNASFEFSLENQAYIASGVTAATVAPRNDKLRTERLLVVYKPRRVFEVDLSYKFEQRESDEALFEYKDKLASVTFKLIF